MFTTNQRLMRKRLLRNIISSEQDWINLNMDMEEFNSKYGNGNIFWVEKIGYVISLDGKLFKIRIAPEIKIYAKSGTITFDT